MADPRSSLNMSVLKRHDKTVTDIVDTVSYVVLYKHDGEWTKTSIEGTMFLFKRSRHPRYGFFILNRQGLENFVDDLVDEQCLEVVPEFLIYTSKSRQETYGLWVFEPEQRAHVAKRMVELCQASSAAQKESRHAKAQQASPQSSSSHSVTANGSTSNPAEGGRQISLEALFGATSLSQPAPQQQQQPTVAHEAPKGMTLLDSLFSSAQTNAPAPQSLSRPQQHQHQPPPPSQPQPKAPSHAQQPKSSGLNERDLMAMIGLAPPSSTNSAANGAAVPTPGPPPAVPTETRPPVPQQQKKQVDGSPTGTVATTTDTSSLLGHGSGSATVNGAALLPRGLDRASFPGELVKALFSEPRVADVLYGLYQAGHL